MQNFTFHKCYEILYPLPDLSPAKQTLLCLKLSVETAWLRISLLPKKPKKPSFFFSDLTKTGQQQQQQPVKEATSWESIFKCCLHTGHNSEFTEYEDELLCQPCFTSKISSNNLCFVFSGDLAHESDQRTLQRCIR